MTSTPTVQTFTARVASQTEGAEVVFLQGLPGAGKSYTRSRLPELADHLVIDPDEVKAAHPDYDPKDPAALHPWSKSITNAGFEAVLAQGCGKFIIDGTGTNADQLVRDIRLAKAAGYRTRVLFVRCTLETSLRRNAARARNVPEYVIYEKAALIATAFEIVQSISGADEITIIDND